MPKQLKVTEEELESIQKLWESGQLSNVKIAEQFSTSKVTEKNIRDWSKLFEWDTTNKKVRKPKDKRPKTITGIKNEMLTKARAKKPKTRIPQEEKTTEDKQLEANVSDLTAMSTESINEITEVVINLILQGEPQHVIKAFINRKYDVKMRLFKDMYERANSYLADRVEKNLNSRFAYHVEARKVLLRKYMDKGDLNGYARTLTDLARLEGVYPKDPLITQNNINAGDIVIEAVIPSEYSEDHFVQQGAYDATAPVPKEDDIEAEVVSNDR